MMKLFATLALVTLLSACASVLDRSARVPHELTSYKPMTGDYMQSSFDDLRARVEAISGQPVTIVTLDDSNLAGQTNLITKGIVLSGELDINGQFEVLAHEAAHLIQPKYLETRAQAEVWAELVAIGVLKHYGVDLRPKTIQYLAGFKSGFSIEPAIRHDVKDAVNVLTGRQEWK